MSNGDSLNWIVPGRRVVVRRNISYRELMDAWLQELRAHSERLSLWYRAADEGALDGLTRQSGGEWSGFNVGCDALEEWISQLGSHGGAHHAVALNEGEEDAQDATIDTASIAFYPRLWKGPLRVIWRRAVHLSPRGRFTAGAWFMGLSPTSAAGAAVSGRAITGESIQTTGVSSLRKRITPSAPPRRRGQDFQ